MRRVLGLLAMATAGLAGGAAQAAPSVEIRNAAVHVVVIPEDRADVEVTVVRANRRLPLYVERFGDQVVVDGRLWPMVLACSGQGDDLRAVIIGKGSFTAAELPQIVVRTPMDARVSSGGVVVGAVGRSRSLNLSHGGCGDWILANVDADMTVRLSGSGGASAGSAGRADVVVSGSGSLRTGPVRGDLDASISGSGDMSAASAGAARLRVSGSGDFKGGPVGGLNAVISGSGDVAVDAVSGPLNADVSGGGAVRAPKGEVSAMAVVISGSGDVDFGGRAASLDAVVSGSGNVHVSAVSGQVNQRVSGSGRVRIGA